MFHRSDFEYPGSDSIEVSNQAQDGLGARDVSGAPEPGFPTPCSMVIRQRECHFIFCMCVPYQKMMTMS